MAAKKKAAKAKGAKKKAAKAKVAAKKAAPKKKAVAKKKPATRAPEVEATKAATETPPPAPADAASSAEPAPPTPRPEGSVSSIDVNLGHVFALKPRVNTTFRQPDFIIAKRSLQDEVYASVPEAARAVAEKALELTHGSSTSAVTRRRRGEAR